VGNSLTALLLASQEGLCSMELVNNQSVYLVPKSKRLHNHTHTHTK